MLTRGTPRGPRRGGRGGRGGKRGRGGRGGSNNDGPRRGERDDAGEAGADAGDVPMTEGPKGSVVSLTERIREVQSLRVLDYFQQLDYLPLYPTDQLEEYIDDYFKDTDFSDHPRLRNPAAQNQLKGAMRAVYGRTHALFSIDCEAYENNNDSITEVGIAIYDPRGQQRAMTPNINQIHIKIEENLRFKNGRFVPDHRDEFNGSVSYVMPQLAAVRLIQSLVDYYFLEDKQIPTVAVGHNVLGDIAWLEKLGISFPQRLEVVDTEQIFSLSNGKEGSSVKAALHAVKIPHARLHNGGNDAYYTLLLAIKLCDPYLRQLLHLDEPYFANYMENKREEWNCSKKSRFIVKTPSKTFDRPVDAFKDQYAFEAPPILIEMPPGSGYYISIPVEF